MTTPINVIQQSQLDPRQAAQLRAIYESSFPPSERGDVSKFAAAIASRVYSLFTAIDGNDLLGFAVTLRLTPSDVHLLSYLAVAQQARNRGIGEKLMRGATQLLRDNAHATALILEVESPDESNAEERHLRERRIEFYRRLGATMIEGAPRYRAPNLAGTGTLNFKLMWLPLVDSAKVPTGEQLKQLVLAIYVQSYKLTSGDPLVVEALQELK
ncbi:MAG: GNAT family N-acetyltransferase [Chloroflexi bacterium]|nr:GNAT family N-acetyltransferase [Chloroflexota bacterium]